MSFIGLHNHTAEGSNHRLRDSINKIPDIIEYAHSLGHKGVAFTEHESITSSFNALTAFALYEEMFTYAKVFNVSSSILTTQYINLD